MKKNVRSPRRVTASAAAGERKTEELCQRPGSRFIANSSLRIQDTWWVTNTEPQAYVSLCKCWKSDVKTILKAAREKCVTYKGLTVASRQRRAMGDVLRALQGKKLLSTKNATVSKTICQKWREWRLSQLKKNHNNNTEFAASKHERTLSRLKVSAPDRDWVHTQRQTACKGDSMTGQV